MVLETCYGNLLNCNDIIEFRVIKFHITRVYPLEYDYAVCANTGEKSFIVQIFPNEIEAQEHLDELSREIGLYKMA